MAEISRKEAINILEKSWSYHNEINHAHSKAISDMEKLEKIEKELFHWEDWILAESPNGYRDAIEYSADDMQRMICRTIRECSNAIEQIVKEQLKENNNER